MKFLSKFDCLVNTRFLLVCWLTEAWESKSEEIPYKATTLIIQNRYSFSNKTKKIIMLRSADRCYYVRFQILKQQSRSSR